MRTGGGKFIGWKVLAVRIGRLMGGLFAPWGGSCWGGIHGAVGGSQRERVTPKAFIMMLV